jgi:hypothetical protein
MEKEKKRYSLLVTRYSLETLDGERGTGNWQRGTGK